MTPLGQYESKTGSQGDALSEAQPTGWLAERLRTILWPERGVNGSMRHPEYARFSTHDESPAESDSRSRIIRAAYPLFVRQGYDSVSMQEIADAVPIHKATLYHHFESKDDLFLAVARSAMSQLYGQIQHFIEEGGTAADQLTRVAMQVFRDSQSEFGRLMSDARLHLSTEQQQMLVERGADPWTLYEQIFASAIDAGELEPIDCTLAATMFVGLLYGQTWSVRTGRIQPPLDEERARLIVETLFGGLNAVASSGGGGIAPGENSRSNPAGNRQIGRTSTLTHSR